MKDEIKVGDTVERINSDLEKIKVGDICTVTKIEAGGYNFFVKERYGSVLAENFKKVYLSPESLITKAKAIITQLEACAPLIEELKEITSQLNEEKYDYPLYMKSNTTGSIVKFTGLESGVRVTVGRSDGILGAELHDFIEHTDREVWQPCKKPDVWTEKDLSTSQKLFCGKEYNEVLISSNELRQAWNILSGYNHFTFEKALSSEQMATYLNDNKYTKGE